MVSTFTGSVAKVGHYTNEATMARPDLGGQMLRVTYPVTGPWVMSLNESTPGYANVILNSIANRLNFTYQYVTPESGNYGSDPNKTGQFNGMIGELQNNRADIGLYTDGIYRVTVLASSILFCTSAIGDLSLTPERSLVVSQSVELFKDGMTFYYPENLGHKDIYWQAFLTVFHRHLWFAIAGLMIVFFSYILLLFFVSPGGTGNRFQDVIMSSILSTISITLRAFAGLSSDPPQVKSIST